MAAALEPQHRSPAAMTTDTSLAPPPARSRLTALSGLLSGLGALGVSKVVDAHTLPLSVPRYASVAIGVSAIFLVNWFVAVRRAPASAPMPAWWRLPAASVAAGALLAAVSWACDHWLPGR